MVPTLLSPSHIFRPDAQASLLTDMPIPESDILSQTGSAAEYEHIHEACDYGIGDGGRRWRGLYD